MGALLPWLALAAAITVINGASLSYLARREHSGALRRWGLAWFAWAAATVPLMLLDPSAGFSFGFLATGGLWVVSALAFLSGGYELLGRSLPRIWYAVAALSAVVAIVMAFMAPSPLAMAPLALFQCVALTASGISILRNVRRRAGAWMYGSSLILLGLHVLDAPIVTRLPWLVAWGFVLALSLEVIAAVGMVVLHYEHARDRLLHAERALEQQRRMEALGRVAGGVAHDFNNLLTILQGELDLLRSERASPQSRTEALRGIDGAIQQGARLSRQLLAFGRRAETRAQRIDVREVVETTLELLRRLVPKSVELELRCAEADHSAVLDRALLEQIVLNLVTNARDAISEAGRIEVELELHSGPAEQILLRVCDDGAGMDEELVHHIFEPFFTTKGHDRGTGLGLASVEGAVSQLGGSIRVESKPGLGTTFEVMLPRS